MSTLNTVNITNGTDSITVEGAVKGSAKAWVNFNGTGVVAIRASYNVSSITDNGTGDYTVNFTTAMPDTNFTAVGIGEWTSGTTAANVPTMSQTSTTLSVNYARVRYINFANSQVDPPLAQIAIFR